jgi:hypothetical protein
MNDIVPCRGSGRGAVFDFKNPTQETQPIEGRDFTTGEKVTTTTPSNGQCVYCKRWMPITERGTLVRHDVFGGVPS